MTPRPRRREPERPTFNAAHPSEADTRRVREVLEHIPQRPRPLRKLSNVPLAFQSVAEYVIQQPEWLAKLHGRVRGFPKPFRKVHFKSWDAAVLTAWLGVHTEGGQETKFGSRGKPIPREGILLVPGMFTTKDMAIQKARALKIFKEWGYHVMSLDLRGFGESTRVFNTGGWKESEDVEAAVDFFRSHVPLQKIHVYAESLGATAAILAAGRQAKRGFRLVDGGILAVSPYADAKKEIEHLDQRPILRDQFYMVQWFFVQLLHLNGQDYPNFYAYLEAAAKAYGVSMELLLARASARHVVGDVNCPLLILHAKDDPVVPQTEAKSFERLVRGRRNPSTWILPWGNHCLFELVDPDWFWTLLREFFDFYCVLPPRTVPAAAAGRPRKRARRT